MRRPSGRLFSRPSGVGASPPRCATRRALQFRDSLAHTSVTALTRKNVGASPPRCATERALQFRDILAHTSVTALTGAHFPRYALLHFSGVHPRSESVQWF